MLEFEGELIFARESALGTEQGEHGSFPLWLGRRQCCLVVMIRARRACKSLQVGELEKHFNPVHTTVARA
jgi:hypothetical protein